MKYRVSKRIYVDVELKPDGGWYVDKAIEKANEIPLDSWFEKEEGLSVLLLENDAKYDGNI